MLGLHIEILFVDNTENHYLDWGYGRYGWIKQLSVFIVAVILLVDETRVYIVTDTDRIEVTSRHSDEMHHMDK